MDLSRIKAEKDARDSQDLALARQRQSLLIREQAQRVATIPVRDQLLFLSVQFLYFRRLPQRNYNRNKAQLSRSLNLRSKLHNR